MTGSIEAFIRDHADRFREARLLVRNEFAGLDAHEQYFNAFSRLLRMDPLGRVLMLGTDQRDLFVPVIAEGIAKQVKRPGPVLDIGCGDGKTFSLFSGAIPEGAEIDAFDPNPDYVAQFAKLVGADARLRLRHCEPGGFGAEPAFAKAGGYSLITAIHVIYFSEDLEASLAGIFHRLAPGGVAFVVFADELEAFTGVCCRAWLDRIGDRAGRDAHEAVCRARLELFETARLQAMLGEGAEVEVRRQPSRLFGHTIADVIALANLTGLAAVEDPAKFEVAAGLVEQSPEAVGFRIEGEAAGARGGMFSVAQPQLVATIRKGRA